MSIQKEQSLLRELAKRVSEIACHPIQRENSSLWKSVNALRPCPPPIRITEIPWHEMNRDDELTLLCEDPFHREAETFLRQTLYEWKHFKVNNVFENKVYCPLVLSDNGFGVDEVANVIKTNEENPEMVQEYYG